MTKFNEIENYIKDKMRLFGNSEDVRGKAIMEVLTNMNLILDKKENSDKVLLTISGGVANLAKKPFGIELEIRDYDVEGLDAEGDERCKKDEDGEWYQEMIWEATEQVD